MRQKHSGLDAGYCDFKKIFEEEEHIQEFLKKNRQWRVVDTTNKSIEETAWEIIYHVFGAEHNEYS